jgi:pyridoxal phosphate enzyme (YggS family)
MEEAPIDELSERLQSRLAQVRERIAAACARVGRSREEITLVAVTKTVSSVVAGLLPSLGVVDLGENRPQAIWQKAEELDHLPLCWHLIGHLQRNKIEKTLTYQPALIHSVDSLRLLQALESESTKQSRIVPILLEVNASREANKQGFAPEELPALGETIRNLKSLQLEGLMTMAAFDAEPENCRPTFREARELRDRFRKEWNLPLPHLSMGMSNDFEVAIEEGATLIRLGTVLFGDQ